jgi:enoyl-CoA hydratase/carnithine racemase
MILACCCDFRVVSETAVFGLPEVKRSISVIMGTQRITRVAGLAATKEMTLLADNFGAEQAQRYGLVTRLVADDQLETAVAALANKFRKLPPRAVGVAKRIIDEGYTMTMRQSQDLEIEAQQELLNSSDFQEAIAAFFEKRPPRYTGH